MQTIFPILRYDDAREAMAWLCRAFGFVEVLSVPESGPTVRHARLRLGTNVIMLGSTRPDDGLSSPRTVERATQALCVSVDDLDGHFERARSAGAPIVSPPRETDFGAREYHARDLEAHPWIFGTSLPSPQVSDTAPAPIKPAVSLADVDKLDVRVGTIRAVEEVEASRKLVRLRVDFGDHTRSILAGLKEERTDPRVIEGRQALFVVNLEPRRMAGEVSEGMLFDIGYADGLTPVLAVPESPVPAGTRVG
jgi:tRNA-binding protein